MSEVGTCMICGEERPLKVALTQDGSVVGGYCDDCYNTIKFMLPHPIPTQET